MILYLTYNDQPSGVYWSQVTDVVEHLNTLGGPKVILVALVSGRDFLGTRRKIKQHSPSAWVLPMVPTMKRWKKNTAILGWVCRLLRPTGLICRGPFATWMALRMRERGLTKRVCFDGRGAYAAEWEEYRIVDDDALIDQLRPLESEAVKASDFRIAVSHALVAHWRERYHYSFDAHVVIPCTLGKDNTIHPLDEPLSWRAENHIPAEAKVLVYSGSTAGWQSFALLKALLGQVMVEDGLVHILFLSRDTGEIAALAKEFPGRVHRLWVDAQDVQTVLWHCDLGILVREDTITNRVASPTKFAEYLAGGLKVVISPSIGDLSDLVQRDALGMVWSSLSKTRKLERTTAAEKGALWGYAQQRFTKRAFDTQYGAILHSLDAR